MPHYEISEIEFPKTFISDPGVGREYVDGIQASHNDFWNMIKLMEEHLEGKKPKDPAKLKAQGKLWSNNWNYNKGRAKLEKLVAENIDTVLNAVHLMSVSFDELTDEELLDEDYAWLMDEQIKLIVASMIERVFIDTIDREHRLLPYLNRLEYNSTAWGWAAATRDIRRDWMGCAHHVRAIGFEDKTRPEKVNGFVTYDTIQGKELWRLWKKYQNSRFLEEFEDTAHQKYNKSPSGWVVEGLEEALYHCYNGKFNADGRPEGVLTSFEDILPLYMERNSYTMLNTDNVSIAKIHTFEFEAGKYTTTYLSFGNNWRAEEANGRFRRYEKNHVNFDDMQAYEPKFFLFQKTEAIQDQAEVLNIIIDSGFTQNGYIHEMRGLAKYCVEDSIRFNRKKNSIEDKLLFSGSPHLQKTAAGDGEGGPKLIPSQGYTVMARGYQFVPDQPQFDLSNHMNSIMMDEQHYLRETSHFNPDVTGKLSSRPVTAEVDAATAEVQRIEGAKLDIKLLTYDSLFLMILKGLAFHLGGEDNMESNLLPEAKRGFEFFKEEMLAELTIYGIDDDERLKKVINKVGSVGLEKVTTDIDAILEQLSQARDEFTRNRLMRMLAFAQGFSRKDVKLMHPITPHPMTSDGVRVASIENEMFKETQEVVFNESDPHITHLDTHFPKLFGLFETISQTQGDPLPTFNWINRLSGHIAFHVDALLTIPYIVDEIKVKYLEAHRDSLETIEGIQKEIEMMMEELQKAQEEAAANQEGQQQIDPKVQAEIENRRFELINKEQIAAQRSQFRAEEKAKQSEFDRRLKEQTHQQKLKHQAELQNLKMQVEQLNIRLKQAS